MGERYVRLGGFSFEVDSETARIYEPSFREKVNIHKKYITKTYKDIWEAVRLVDNPRYLLGLFKIYSARQRYVKDWLNEWKRKELNHLKTSPESAIRECSCGAVREHLEDRIGKILVEMGPMKRNGG